MEPAQTPVSWGERARVIAPVLLAVPVLLLLYEPRVELGGDNALYWALTRSLLETGEYRNLGAPGLPLETSVPWGYPALLALASTVVGAEYTRMKWVSLLSMVAAIPLLVAWSGRLGLRGWLGFGAMVLVVINSRIQAFGSMVLTEAPYVLLSFAVLWWMDRPERSPRTVLAGATIAALSYLVRPIGLSLVLAIFLWLAWQRRWRELALAALPVALIDGSWHLRALLNPSEEENLYLHYLVKRGKYQTDDATAGLADMVARFLHNAAAYLLDKLPGLATGWRDADAFAYPFLALLLIGFVATIRPLRLVHLYLPLYLGVLFLWLPESVSDRYLVVVHPLFVVLACEGAAWAGARLGRWGAAIPAIFFAVQAVGLLDELVDDASRLARVRPKVAAGDVAAGWNASDVAFRNLCLWARDSVPRGALFASRKDRMVWFWSEHVAVPLPSSDDADEILRYFADRRVDYVVIDSIKTTSAPTRDRLAPALDACPACFEVVRSEQNGDSVVRFIAPPGAP